MVLQELEDRLYTSTEVANILGVSLRSVYRYLEDGKLDAEMKTATGRHRFTKQNIIDFMSPQSREDRPIVRQEAPKVVERQPISREIPRRPVVEQPVAPVQQEVVEETESEEEVDWLTKFRQAAEKYRAEQEEPEVSEVPVKTESFSYTETVSGLTDTFVASEPEQPMETPSANHFYKSNVGGLKDIAQNIDKSARKASLDYAFTLDAGLSLHKPIRPFSIIHAYVKPEDLAFFEKILDLRSTDESEAQLCLIVSEDSSLFNSKREMHGLNVVSDERLKEDLRAAGKDDLLSELN